MAPYNGFYLNTLGLAQHRLGPYQQALNTLSRSNKVSAAYYQTSIPADLAFQAMAHHQLGQKEQAQDYLNHLRDAVNKPQWAGNEEAQAFLREAEPLLQRAAAAPKKRLLLSSTRHET